MALPSGLGCGEGSARHRAPPGGLRHHGTVSARPTQPRSGSRAGVAARTGSRPSGRSGSGPRQRKSSAAEGSRGAAPEARESDGSGEPRQVTLRSIGIVLVLLVAFIVLAPTLRAYITQQEQLRDLNSQLADTNERIAQLEAELARWDEPDYVRQQARDRFSYVAPGETAYRVVDPETVTGEDPMGDLTAEAEGRSPYAPSASDPWYVSVWESVEVAGAAEETLAEEAAAGDAGVGEGGEAAEGGDAAGAGDAAGGAEGAESSGDVAGADSGDNG